MVSQGPDPKPTFPVPLPAPPPPEPLAEPHRVGPPRPHLRSALLDAHRRPAGHRYVRRSAA